VPAHDGGSRSWGLLIVRDRTVR